MSFLRFACCVNKKNPKTHLSWCLSSSFVHVKWRATFVCDARVVSPQESHRPNVNDTPAARMSFVGGVVLSLRGAWRSFASRFCCLRLSVSASLHRRRRVHHTSASRSKRSEMFVRLRMQPSWTRK